MILDNIVKEPQKCLIHMERYVNDGSPSGFTWVNQTSNDTSPIGKNEFFYLDYLICDKKTERVGNLPALFDSFDDNVMLIHPDMKKIYMEQDFVVNDSDLKVIPTSSSRTVKILNYSGYLKLNYNGIIGRIDRSLTDKHAYASVELTSYLTTLLKDRIFSELSFFPEEGAIIYKDNTKDINVGAVYRSDKVYGINSTKIKMIIPLFSLFSKDAETQDEPLLIQLIKRKKQKPVDFLLNEIIYKIVDNYFKLLIYSGLQPEWHSQNLLLGLDENFHVVSLIMRDLESIDVDQNLQQRIGISKLFKSYPYKYINNRQYNYQIKHSFMYDFKIGEYVFTPLINCLNKYFGIDIEEIEHEIKKRSHTYIKLLPDDFFPENEWYSFENIIIDRSKEERPYIVNTFTKYR